MNNLDKLGRLEPNITREVIITANFIKSAINQIDLIGKHNNQKTKMPIEYALYDMSLAVITTDEAMKALNYIIPKLENLIRHYSTQMSSPFSEISDQILEKAGKKIDKTP